MGSEGLWGTLGNLFTGIFGSKKAKQEAAKAASLAKAEEYKLQQKALELEAAKQRSKTWLYIAAGGVVILVIVIFLLKKRR